MKIRKIYSNGGRVLNFVIKSKILKKVEKKQLN